MMAITRELHALKLVITSESTVDAIHFSNSEVPRIFLLCKIILFDFFGQREVGARVKGFFTENIVGKSFGERLSSFDIHYL